MHGPTSRQAARKFGSLSRCSSWLHWIRRSHFPASNRSVVPLIPLSRLRLLAEGSHRDAQRRDVPEGQRFGSNYGVFAHCASLKEAGLEPDHGLLCANRCGLARVCPGPIGLNGCTFPGDRSEDEVCAFSSKACTMLPTRPSREAAREMRRSVDYGRKLGAQKSPPRRGKLVLLQGFCPSQASERQTTGSAL